MGKKTSQRSKGKKTTIGSVALGAKSTASTKALQKMKNLNNKNNYSTSVDHVISGNSVVKGFAAGEKGDRERKKNSRWSNSNSNSNSNNDTNHTNDTNDTISNNINNPDSRSNLPTIIQPPSSKRKRDDDTNSDVEQPTARRLKPSPSPSPSPSTTIKTSTTDNFRHEMASAQARFSAGQQTKKIVNNRKSNTRSKNQKRKQLQKEKQGTAKFDFQPTQATDFSNAPKSTDRLISDAINGISGGAAFEGFGEGGGTHNAERPFSYVPESATFVPGDIIDVDIEEQEFELESTMLVKKYNKIKKKRDKNKNLFASLLQDSDEESESSSSKEAVMNEYGEISKKACVKITTSSSAFNFKPAAFAVQIVPPTSLAKQTHVPLPKEPLLEEPLLEEPQEIEYDSDL